MSFYELDLPCIPEVKSLCYDVLLFLYFDTVFFSFRGFIIFFNFIFTLFYFTILYWFCHTLTWIHHGCIQAPNPISQEAGQVVWYSHLFQNFPQFLVIHTVEGCGIVNKAEIDVFLELSCFFDDSAEVWCTNLNILYTPAYLLPRPRSRMFLIPGGSSYFFPLSAHSQR